MRKSRCGLSQSFQVQNLNQSCVSAEGAGGYPNLAGSSGFGLVQVLASAAIMGVLALTGAALIVNQLKGSRTAEVDDSIRQAMNEYRLILGSAELCDKNVDTPDNIDSRFPNLEFSASAVSSSAPPELEVLKLLRITPTTPPELDSARPIFAKGESVIGANGVKLKEAKLKITETLESDKFLARLVFTFDRGEVVGPSEVRRALLMELRTSASGANRTIIGCKAVGETAPTPQLSARDVCEIAGGTWSATPAPGDCSMPDRTPANTGGGAAVDTGVTIYQCPMGVPVVGWCPGGGAWASYGCQGQISTLAYCQTTVYGCGTYNHQCIPIGKLAISEAADGAAVAQASQTACQQRGSQWVNGECLTNQQACERQGNSWASVFDPDSGLTTNECRTPQQQCQLSRRVWDNGACRDPNQAEQCAMNGGSWINYSWGPQCEMPDPGCNGCD